ncbi:hypothetical protein [Treponema sp. R80B11-R83G3]
MKKLIVLSVVFALVAAAAFAVDVGANVFGKVTPFQGASGKNADGTDLSDDDTKVTASGGFERLRLDGYGEVQDGKFGGYIRFNGDTTVTDAYAFWKPIDQLKVLIGGNGDGFYGKEGITGWMFNENPYDGGVAFGGNNIWGWGSTGYYGGGEAGDTNAYGQPIKTRHVFYGGYGGNALHLNITPIDILGINIAIPFQSGGETADVFKNTMAQLDVKLDFGNIALTYEGASGEGLDQSKIYLYYGGSFGDLGIDFGFSYKLAGKDEADESVTFPIGVGLGVKYATDAFGVKFRAVATLGGDDKLTCILTELQPYFPLGDNLVAFVGLGLSMTTPDEGDAIMGWHFNPYIRVGEEWGAQFLVGVQVYSQSAGDGGDGRISWNVPVAIMLMF